ncbi:MAG: hypothetical protein J6N22_07355 [Schwartzia sp.]|nr:hypothetical protein [Schwartzia sp. (in: firmicutes)]MBP3690840.1 hypothetical protein [Schwartzia sp. (in: firmicutes)]
MGEFEKNINIFFKPSAKNVFPPLRAGNQSLAAQGIWGFDSINPRPFPSELIARKMIPKISCRRQKDTQKNAGWIFSNRRISYMEEK